MKIDQIIKSRKTQKVLANSPWEISIDKEELKKVINDLLELVEFAPYYKKCHKFYTDSEHELNSCVPWRFYILETDKCRDLYHFVEKEKIKAGKISNMLAAADALFIVNWLPNLAEINTDKDPIEDLSEEPFPFTGSEDNMTHIASCAAAIQNVLIGATARDIPTYWSSGGKLREQPIKNYLDIPMREILLGAIFLFPKDSETREAIIKNGALRNQGKERDSWRKWIK